MVHRQGIIIIMIIIIGITVHKVVVIIVVVVVQLSGSCHDQRLIMSIVDIIVILMDVMVIVS